MPLTQETVKRAIRYERWASLFFNGDALGDALLDKARELRQARTSGSLVAGAGANEATATDAG